MTPIPQRDITVTICNRTKSQWQWIESVENLGTEKSKIPSSCKISAKGKSSLKSTLQPSSMLKAVLQKSSTFNQSQQPSFDITLNVFPASRESHGCFKNNSARFDSLLWLPYPSLADKADQYTNIKLLYRQTSTTHIDFLILPNISPSSFLSALSDNSYLSQLCLPGTHESLALYGWPISTCQSSQSSVQKQLQDGIRYLDVRLVPKGEPGHIRLLAYHGVTDERIEFGAVLKQCWQFLENQDSKRETIIMSIKQESGDQDTFIRTLFDTYVDQTPAGPGKKAYGRDRWFLENRIPTLGEVRGKIVMLSRFVIDPSYGFPGGISPPIWPNSFKGIFDYTLPSGQKVITQDWYDIGSLSQLDVKFSLIEQLSKDSGTQDNTFALNYTNGSSFPFALPPAVAKGFLDDGTKAPTACIATQGINSRLRNFVADLQFDNVLTKAGALPGLRVTWAIDYYDEPKGAQDLVSLLISANF